MNEKCWNMLKDCISLMTAYKDLLDTGKLTKAKMCEIGKSFAKKYDLSDIETLKIMRGQYNIEQLVSVIEASVLQ